jgi:hypothetical protein
MGLLRQLFGPSKDEIWSQLSHDIGGTFAAGGVFGTSKVTLSHRQWVITLDTFAVSTGKVTVIYTRLRAPYVNPDGFQFNIYRKSVFSWMGKMLGVQDVEVGEPFFDDEFIIQGTTEPFVKQLLANPEIRHLMQLQPDVHFQVKDDEGWFGTTFPDGVDELYFLAYGVIKDVDRLKHLFDLFSVVLDELCRLGRAYEGEPGVRLK